MNHAVTIHFDFVSPYSYLALTQVEEFARRWGVKWEVRPVLYGALLDATGLLGPAEVAIKRDYTARDIMRCADRLGVPLVGPPAHPFNPLAALRTECLFQEDPRALSLAGCLADFCWGKGRDLTDPDVLEEAVRDTGLDGTALQDRIAAPEIKAELRRNTAAALEAGVFGVPTFVWKRELFWGHDRLDQLADRLTNRLSSPEARAAAWCSRPRAVDRRTLSGRT